MAHEHAEPATVIDLGTFGEGKTTAVVKETTFEVIRLVVEPGKPIPPHQVAGPITVQCLRGRCQFSIGDQSRTLTPGAWLYLEGSTLHAVEAEVPSVLLITIMFPANR